MEDNGYPLFALRDFVEILGSAAVRPPVKNQVLSACQPIAATNFVAMPSSMAWLGRYVEGKGSPISLTQFTMLIVDAMTIRTWLPQSWHSPEIIENITSLLSSVAQEGYQEDDGNSPVTWCWCLVVMLGLMQKHPAIVSRRFL